MKKEAIDDLTKALVDQGLLIEAGWVGLKLMSVPKDAGVVQIREMRNAFFAGAQHLYASILGFLDPGKEETEMDLHRMQQIHNELDAFFKNYKEENLL